ncbi:MAG: hypothetical protein HQK75_17675 [Candidatus Magnetomorum sp.]|nr:hypothetical protein [Candidatus Magnetomorum sp.]
MISESKSSSIQLLASLSNITKRISESLKQNATAEQLDSLSNEHQQVMEQLKQHPFTELKGSKSLIENVHSQVQSVREELSRHHHSIKEKLVSFSKKRKQLHAYNAL